MHGLRLLRGVAVRPVTDGPYRFVGHDDFTDAVAVEMDDGGELALDDDFRFCTPASRWASVAPTQTMGVIPATSARCTLG